MAPVETSLAVAVAETTASSTAPRPRKLRVGLFADARLQPRWALEAFARLAASEFAEVVLVALLDQDAAANARHAAPAALRLYSRLDRWAFGAADPGERADIAAVLGQEVVRLGAPHGIPVDLDVAFALGEFDDRVLDGIARCGVWRFYFGEDAANEGEALAGWREVAQGAPLSASGLKVRLTASGPTRLAYQSWARTYPFSVTRNRSQLLLKTSEFVWRALRDAEIQAR